MRKTTLFFTLGFAWASMGIDAMQAQTADIYTWEPVQTTGAYEALEDATVLQQSTVVKGSDFKTAFFNDTEELRYQSGIDANMDGIDIGFDFYFEGVLCDKFVAAGTGFVLLSPASDNKVEIAGDVAQWTHGWPFSVGIGVNQDVIGIESTAIRYVVTGDAPNRVLAIEYWNLTHVVDQTTDPFNFQIRLYEGSNKIEMLFDAYTVPEQSTDWGVGIEGQNGKRMHVQPNGPPTGRWWKIATPMANNAGVTSLAAKTVFDKGTLFGFSTPPACERPTKAADSMWYTAKDDEISLTFRFTEAGEADGYLLLASENGFEGEGPVAGTEYTEGESLNGGKVIAIGNIAGNEVICTHRGLEESEKYYYRIYPRNYRCTGVQYGEPYTDSAVTQSGPPSLQVTGFTDSTVILKAAPNRQNHEVLVAVTDYNRTVGVPDKDTKVGDTLWTSGLYPEFGGVVIYMGPAKEGIAYRTATESNKAYFFAAYSKMDMDNYSPSYAEADTLIPPALPFYEDFLSKKQYEVPYGWKGTEGFDVSHSTSLYGGVYARIDQDASQHGYSASLVFPAMDFPAGDFRLRFEYGIWTENTVWNRAGMTAEEWSEHDSIVFEISSDGGENYSVLHAIVKGNAEDFASENDFVEDVLVFSLPEPEEQAKLRIRYALDYKEGLNRVYLKFKYFDLQAIAPCDYPAFVEVIDSTIRGDKATVRWAPGYHNESAWNLSYVLQGEQFEFGEWSEAVRVNGSSYQLSGLENHRRYKVRLQSVCGEGLVSRWVETEFVSAYMPAFVEDFNQLEEVFSDGAVQIHVGWKLPDGWDSRRYNGSSVPDSVLFSSMTAMTQPVYNYKEGRSSAIVPGETNAAVAMPLSSLSNGLTVLRLPSVAVRPEEDPRFIFQYTYGELDENEDFHAVDTNRAKYHDHMYVWVSTNGGNTFVIDSAVQVWDFADLSQADDSVQVSIDLSRYGEQDLVLAIGVHSTMSSAILYLDNIGVVYGCPSAKFLRVEEGSVTENTAAFTWREDPTRSSWEVILREYGEDDTEPVESTVTVDGNRVEFNELKEATRYMVLVGQDCADTAHWSRLDFTTGGVPCPEPLNPVVADIGQRSAQLDWEGSASAYRIRIRIADTAQSGKAGQWAYHNHEGASPYRFGNLLPGVAYEGGIQAVCGLAAGDTSAYVDFEPFTTLDESCFAPDSVSVDNITHYSAEISWKADAQAYVVECYAEGETVPLGVYAVEDVSVVVDGLWAESSYSVRVRAVCSPGDTSAWSRTVSFHTAAAPECAEPVNLSSEVLSSSSARLMWEEGSEENAVFAVRFSVAAPVSYQVIEDVAETEYLLEGLEAETLYLWSVMSVCRGGGESVWASRADFETEPLANEQDVSDGFRVYMAKGQLHVLNPSALPIDCIRLYSATGVLDGNWTVNSCYNVILPLQGRNSGLWIVEVESAGRLSRYKVVMM